MLCKAELCYQNKLIGNTNICVEDGNEGIRNSVHVTRDIESSMANALSAP